MLLNLARECSADSITIVAHSAGSPFVVNALREMVVAGEIELRSAEDDEDE